MPKFKVVLNEIASYETIVTAKNEEEAAEKAERKMQRQGVRAFKCEVHERDCEHVEQI